MWHYLPLHTNGRYKIRYKERIDGISMVDIGMVNAKTTGIIRGLASISPIRLTLLSILIALILALSFDSDELDVIGNALIGIGGILIITSSQDDYLQGLLGERQRRPLT